MKVKLTKEQVERIVADPQAAGKAKIEVTDPWWVTVLKVVRYIIELILAGGVGYASGLMVSALAVIAP